MAGLLCRLLYVAFLGLFPPVDHLSLLQVLISHDVSQSVLNDFWHHENGSVNTKLRTEAVSYGSKGRRNVCVLMCVVYCTDYDSNSCVSINPGALAVLVAVKK